MRGLLSTISHSDLLAEGISTSRTLVAPSTFYPFAIALRAKERPLIVVTASSRSAEDLVHELRTLHDCVYEFPAWETLPHERLSPRSDTAVSYTHLTLPTIYSV